MQKSNDDSDAQRQPLRGIKVDEYVQVEARLSIDQKAILATHLASNLGANLGSPEDVENAESILRLIIWSDEKRIIESLAQAAAKNPDTTRNLAWALANDDDTAAVPILAAAVSLSDADLIAIVESADSIAKMGAIARRTSVSEALARSLVDHGDENISLILLNNAKADIPADALACMVDRHGQHEFIQENIIVRDALPPAVAGRLFPLISSELAQRLLTLHQLPTASAIEIALMCHKPARVGYVNELSSDSLNELIFQVLEDEILTPQILVRSLCFGNFDFFCRAFSFMAMQSKDQISELILTSPAIQISKLWSKTSFSNEWLPVVSAAATAFAQLEESSVKSDICLFRKNIMERTLSLLEKEGSNIPAGQMDFLRQIHPGAGPHSLLPGQRHQFR